MAEINKNDAEGLGSGARRFGARIIGIVTSANRNDPAMWDALAACDIAEFRADLFEPRNIPAEFLAFRADLDRRGIPVETLLTIRLQRDGGSWPDAHAGRREAVWEELGFAGRQPAAEFIDIEIEEYPGMGAAFRLGVEGSGAKLVLSHHDFQGCPGPARLRSLLAEMAAHKPAAIKFAVTCENKDEAAMLLAFAREVAVAAPASCVLSMGEAGRSFIQDNYSHQVIAAKFYKFFNNI